jgi:hypothetical protein
MLINYFSNSDKSTPKKEKEKERLKGVAGINKIEWTTLWSPTSV